MCKEKTSIPEYIKDMFGEKLKSAVTESYIWIGHMRADAVWFLTTEKYFRSRLQGRKAALGPAPGSLQPFSMYAATWLIFTPLGSSL